MSKTLADLTAAIKDNTTAANAVAAAFGNSSQTDFTAQVDAIEANTTTLHNLLTASPGPLSASPASISLSETSASATVTLTESDNQPNTFQAVSDNPSIATVSPASGSGPFTVQKVAPGSTTITFTDAQNNTVKVPVNAT